MTRRDGTLVRVLMLLRYMEGRRRVNLHAASTCTPRHESSTSIVERFVVICWRWKRPDGPFRRGAWGVEHDRTR